MGSGTQWPPFKNYGFTGTNGTHVNGASDYCRFPLFSLLKVENFIGEYGSKIAITDISSQLTLFTLSSTEGSLYGNFKLLW